jgi:type II secretory pathway component PulC
VPVTRGSIGRGDLVAVLDAGLGRFLQGVGTEAHLDSGRFVGFRLTRLYPDDERFSAVDLRAGDTVVRVNGRSIERPEQAMRVWQELRVASELMIEYVRSGEPRELRFTIEDQ